MNVDYIPFVDRMIDKYEGGYGWNTNDPGGPTKYGITCYDLAEHRGQKMDSMSRWAPIVQAMTRAEAEAIYRTKYAERVMFDALPAGPDVFMMDYEVNSGSRAVSVAYQMCGLPRSTTMTAPLVTAISNYGAKKFVDDMAAERLRFMHAIRGGSAWTEFGRGWQARVDDLRVYAEHLADGRTHETAPLAKDSSTLVQPKAIHVPKTATTPTVGGAGTVAVGMHTAGYPIWGTAIAVGCVIAAGVAYELYEEMHTNTLNLKMA